MKALLVSFVSGIVFALGLGISGMTRPVKVIGFLDFAGKWDASLALVMIGATAVYFSVYRLARSRTAPLFAEKFSVPERKDIDRNLLLGAALFGVGWGLSGFCPGPAITSLASGAAPVFVFVIAMAAGIYLYGLVSGLGGFKIRSLPTPVQVATDA
jgi:uncharacterized membrane protein YedE/YeeE